jgi:hypothetical protein
MTLISNDWAKVREHYSRFEADILAEDRNEWAKDSDRETGAPGPAQLFIQRICDHHGISRNTRTIEDKDWHSADDVIEQMIRSFHGQSGSNL